MAKSRNPQNDVQASEAGMIPRNLVPPPLREDLPPITIEGFDDSEPDEEGVVHLTIVASTFHEKLRALIAQQIADAIAAGGGSPGGGGTPAPTVQALADYNDVTNASGTFTVFSVTDSLYLHAVLPAGLPTNGTHLWEVVSSTGGFFSGAEEFLPTKQNTYYQGMAVGQHRIRYTYTVGGASYVAVLIQATRPPQS